MKSVRNLIGDPIAVIRLSMLLTGIVVLAWTQADPDLWGHVRFGHDIVAARSVPQSDGYSFTTDRAWINHEWLAEVAMYGAWRAGGAGGLIVLKLALDLGLIVLVVLHLRRWIPTRLVRDLLVALLIVGILPRALPVRPQLFSLLLFGMLLTLLAGADDGRWRRLLLAPLLMMAWVNLHGGWLVGLGTFGLWLAFRVVQPGVSLGRRAFLVFVGAASAGATLVNPYGIGMWRFLYDTVGLTRPDINDWLPLYRLPAAFTFALWLPVLAGALLLVVRAGRRNVPAYVAIVALLAAASVKVSRLDAFFAIAVVVLLGRSIALRRPAGDDDRLAQPAGPPRPARLAPFALVAAGLLVTPAVLAAQNRVYTLGLRATFLPEPQAARFVLANHLRGRMITWYDWGEYAIWHFSPEIKVSLDGRRETVYSDRTVQANYDFCNARPGALDYPLRLGAAYVWLPNKVAAVTLLERAGWRRVFHGPISSILAPPGDKRMYVEPAGARSSNVFPGP